MGTQSLWRPSSMILIRVKKKEKKKKSKKGKKASSVELVKEDEEEEEGEAKKDEKTGEEPALVSGGGEEPLVIAEEEWESVLDVPVPADTWTEVNISRKKKSHNNHVTFSQTIEAMEPKDDVTAVEESITSHSQEVVADEIREEKAKAKERKVTKS